MCLVDQGIVVILKISLQLKLGLSGGHSVFRGSKDSCDIKGPFSI